MRSKLFYVFTVFLLYYSCQEKSLYQNEIVIEHVNIIPMTGGSEMLRNQSVVINDSKIVKIGKYRPSSTAVIIDGSDQYLVPGLTEMHAHIPVAKEGSDSLVRETLFLFLSQGITTIRGMLGDPYHLLLKDQITNDLDAEDGILGPRIFTSSPSLNGNSVTTPDEAAAKVRQYKKDGYDFLKIHPGIQLNVWEALEKTAKDVGIPYAGHVPIAVGINRALAAGYGTVDHIDGFVEGLVPVELNVDSSTNGFFGYSFTDLADLSLLPPLVKKAKDNNVAIVCTQTLFSRWFSPVSAAQMMTDPEMIYLSPATRFSWRQNKSRMNADSSYHEDKWMRFNELRKTIIKEMDKQGVTFLLGSDAPQVMNVPGFSLHREMTEMADAGLSPAKILQSGTSLPASYFGADKLFGSISEGLSADMILLSKNPLDDINNMSSITAVFVRGTQLSRDFIDKKLKEIQDRYAANDE